MGERKGVNKYYPPDFDPSKGGLNAYHGTHALRERARKLHEGILIIRFEMPYNIWCNGCGIHIGMGVRYNAQKRKVGNYYTTPIYKFKMKCHLCDQYFEIRTDPKNCDYEILSGCRRKEERWDTEKAGNVQTTEREVKEKLMTNAMFKLEHESVDKGKVKKIAPTLSRLEDIRGTWDDDFAVNQLLRKKIRTEKKEILVKTENDNELKRKMNLPTDLILLDDSEDKSKSLRIFSKSKSDIKTDLRTEKDKISKSSIFKTPSNSTLQLAKSLTKSQSSSTLTKPSAVDFGVRIAKKTKLDGEAVLYGDNCRNQDSTLTNSNSINSLSEQPPTSILMHNDSKNNSISEIDMNTATSVKCHDLDNDSDDLTSENPEILNANGQQNYVKNKEIKNDVEINNSRTSLVNYLSSESSDEGT